MGQQENPTIEKVNREEEGRKTLGKSMVQVLTPGGENRFGEDD